MKLGRNLARTFLDYYKLQNHIVFKPAHSLSTKNSHSTPGMLNTTKARKSTNSTSDAVASNASSSSNSTSTTNNNPKEESSQNQTTTNEAKSGIEAFFTLDDR